MLISLHLPKTAGTSFAASLEKHFGSHLLKDYADRPKNTPVFRRNVSALIKCFYLSIYTFKDIECIHGHFLPIKYYLYGAKKHTIFITWMRNPVERLASHYYFWKRNYDPKKASFLHKKMILENWSFERFCLGPEYKNLYSQFLWGFPFSRFDFIGITEYYDTDFKYFTENFLDNSIPNFLLNKNQSKNKSLYIEDPTLIKKIENHHKKDMILYENALNMRSKR